MGFNHVFSMWKSHVQACFEDNARGVTNTLVDTFKLISSSIFMYMSRFLNVASAISMFLNIQVSNAQSSCRLTSLDGEYAYLLPQPFQGNLTRDFIGGTSVDNQTVIGELSKAQGCAFVSYDKEFEDLIGSGSLNLTVPKGPFPSGEAGVWLPDLNQVWFVTTLYGGPAGLYILFLENNTVVDAKLTAAPSYGTHIPLANPAGGYYFNGTVYLALVGNENEPASLVAVDPRTYVVTPVVNSYFGLELPPVDDVIVTYTNTSAGLQKHLVCSFYSIFYNDIEKESNDFHHSISQLWTCLRLAWM